MRKGFARLFYHDALRQACSQDGSKSRLAVDFPAEECGPGRCFSDASYADKALQTDSLEASASDFEAKVAPSTILGRNVGNICSGPFPRTTPA